MLEELCELKIQQSNKNSLPPPYAELEMLECLASDAYYRVIMIKYHGLATIDKASQAFPALAESCQHMLQLLQKAELAPAKVSSPIFWRFKKIVSF